MAEYDIGTIVVLVSGAVSVVVILVTTVYACWQCQSRGGNIVEDQNSGEKAVVYFMRVLEEANEQMIIHDDGDSVKESIYNNKEVMAALDRRLSGGSRLKVRVLFNIPSIQLDILELARKHGDRLRIRYRKGGRPVGDIHYKIADRRMGYFSEHDEGSTDRKIWVYEFQHAPKKARERVFEDPIRRFEQEFAQAEAA